MPVRQQGSRDPASDWLAAVPPANQKTGPRILANQHEFRYRTLPELHPGLYIQITVLEYLCTFGISLYTLNVWNMQCEGRLFSTLEYIDLQILTVWDVRPHAMTCDLYQLPWHFAKHLIQQPRYCCESSRERDIEKRICIASSSLCSQHNPHCLHLNCNCIAAMATTLRIVLVRMGYKLLFATKR